MDIFLLFQRLCHVGIRRLLLIIGILVPVVVVYQCFAISYSKNLPLLLASDKGLVAMTVGNATIIDDSKPTTIFVAMPNDKESKVMATDYNLGLDGGNFFDNSFHKNEDGDSQEGVTDVKSLNVGYVMDTATSSTEMKSIESQIGHIEKDEKIEHGNVIDHDQKSTTGLTLGEDQKRPGITSVVSTQLSSMEVKNLANFSSVGNVKQVIETLPMKTELPQVVSIIPNNNLTAADISILKRLNKHSTSISQMNSLLLQSHVSSHSGRPRWSSVHDRELLLAKREIENAPVLRNTPGLYASVFRNASIFKRSYELMERILKVYIYREGEKPIFHQPRMRGIYASEGWFMKLIEANNHFVVRDPRKAHLFYLPFSAQMLRAALFERNFKSQTDLQNHLKNYVELIAGKYRFWNRTGGADHFLVACHDWAARLTRQHMKNVVRALCNANVALGFKIGMDTTLPVTYIRSVEAPFKELGGNPPLESSILAFFAGGMHGYLRPILLKFWENKEADMKVFGPMPRDVEGKRIYREHMKNSKYCICARGYEVHTPRVVEAIFYECVPVIISDNYVPPFFEVLDWELFSVFVQEKDIPNLRNILLSIREERYLVMQARVKAVQKHFLWHKKPEKYDLFHMILHSIWYNRVFNVKTK
ncbi:probable glycosyltransferase At5g03795 [Pistacia vera]|uniref:probable glycosyltransferase At5g03795 n=1 Tax=Pistacia vera TaxID=55513 RepID=UPI001263150E|nr:probable glycosyltransferase At5g03795 [Pistacia vera]